ncbi:MAG TPA: HupE/UreJ family protein [Vicinamibacterales bacterium]|nr:HupE/UreJ family protein [Vicinamibacterales bacterium]
MTTFFARAATALLGLATVLLATVVVSAHPTAFTHAQVIVSGDGTIEVIFTTIGEALATKLEALAGIHAEPDRSPAAIDRRVLERHATLIAQLTVRGDGGPVPLRLTGIEPVADESGKIAVRLRGQLPSGGSRLSWSTTLVSGTYPLSIRRDGTAAPTADDAFEWLTGTQVSRDYDVASLAGESHTRGFVRSVAVGFAHIVPKGVDHILFVLGLFLLAARTRTVLLQVTAFTVAHSITLALSLYGVFTLPGSVVEPLIALSIVYVAFENLFTSTLTPWRLVLVFAFGLLHGLGFAEALTALDLPRAEFFSTLVAFNLGVEAGQLTVILIAALALLALRVQAADYRRLVVRPASLAIALAGVYWVVDRIST